ncbi:hypothetical protein FKW77_008241 [Venturia effusa]|uniref:Uncharacterized protein n=1 Tax=Venturia effusa TaxID=50376 RepID=A0A517KZX1_9PEZI|nr:hypothetical protein FKW77_008241 [Venturia effusa]
MPDLASLPIELMFEICSYLVHPLSSHTVNPVPVTNDDQVKIQRLRSDRFQLMQHPYCQMAATCQELRRKVEAHCLHLIKEQACPGSRTTRTKVPKPIKDDWNAAVSGANAPGARPKDIQSLPKPKEACRNLYLRSVFQKCMFCGEPTKRRAAFNRFMWCDQKCDVEHYGRLISKTEAASKHQVQETHWQTPQLVFPDSTLKPIRMVIYNTATCAFTTLLLEREVLDMSAYIKANDADGKKLRLARKRIAAQKRADEAKALVKAEDDAFRKIAGNRLTAPSKQDFEVAAGFLRAKLRPQIALIFWLGPDKLAEKWNLCQNLPYALPPNLRELCRVKVKRRNDQVDYCLDIVRSYNGVEHIFPVLGSSEHSVPKKSPEILKPEIIVID